MSSARSHTSSNRALELTHTAKAWLLDLLKTANNPPPSLWGQIPLVNRLPYLGTVATTDRTNHKTSIEYYLRHLKKNHSLRNETKEQEYLKKLHEKLIFPVQEKDRRLFFLLGYYDILNKLQSEFKDYNAYSAEFSGQNDPRLRIIKALKAYYETDSTLAGETGFKPALLDKKLEERELTFSNEPLENPAIFSTGAIQLSMTTSKLQRQNTTPPTYTVEKNKDRERVDTEDWGYKQGSLTPPPPRSAPRSPLPQILNLNSRAGRNPFDRAASEPSLPPLIVIKEETAKHHLSDLVDEAKTLAQYKKACENYSIHLLAAILDELENSYNSNETHSLFKLLKPRAGNHPKQLAGRLLDLYYPPANNGRTIESFMAISQASDSKQLEIDLAIHATRSQFHDAWEKYKLVRKLSQTQNVYAFHRTLNEGRNKEILTKRRDSHLMTFVKLCGLAVATILGLPLGIVGGAYLGYRSLFGSRATEGHLFLNKIDKLTEEGKKPPGRRYCLC